MTHQVSDDISSLGKRLIDRLGAAPVEAALDYVGHGENLLALDTLAGYVEELGVFLEANELAEFLRLAAIFNAASLPPFSHLRTR